MADLIVIIVIFFTAIWAFGSTSIYEKTKIDLTYSKEGLLSKINDLKNKLESRAYEYNSSLEKVSLLYDKIHKLNKSKNKSYFGRLAWKNGFFNKTKETIRHIKITMLLTILTYLLHISTDSNKDNLADFAFVACVIALSMLLIHGINDYITERKAMKGMNLKSFVGSQISFHKEKISILEAKMNRAAESYQDIQESISLIESEIFNRDNLNITNKKNRIATEETYAAIKSKR